MKKETLREQAKRNLPILRSRGWRPDHPASCSGPSLHPASYLTAAFIARRQGCTRRALVGCSRT